MTSSEWRQVSFGDLVAEGVLRVGDGYRAKNNELGGGGPIFLRAGQVRDTHIDFDEADRFIGDLTTRLRAKMSRPGDVVVTTKGNSIGRVTFVTSDMPSFIYSPHLSFWRSLDHDALDPTFLRCWSRSREFRTQLAGFAAQTDMAPFISLRDQLRLKITVPSALAQRVIARTLGPLDDRIDINRRMERTLESIARAIFEAWFIDFEPVRDKMVGKTAHELALPPSVADAFPDRLVQQDGRMVPDGWPLASLGSQVSMARGLSYKGSGLTEAGTPMHNLNSLLEGGGFKPEGLKFYSGAFDERHKVNSGDLLVANTEQGHERKLIGFCCLAPQLGAGTSIFSHHLFRVRPLRSSVLTPEFLYHCLNSRRMQTEVSGYATGTTVNTLPADALTRPLIPLPPQELVAAFSALAASASSLQRNMGDSRATLAALRTSLIPRLLEGKRAGGAG